MKILFCAGVAPIVDDGDASLRFYRDLLGLPLEGDEYVAAHGLDGLKHFGLWPLSDAARSCFGAGAWPDHVARPQACIEFEVDDVDAAVEELRGRGCDVLSGPVTEPWGQEVARLLSPEGLLIGVTWTPWVHEG